MLPTLLKFSGLSLQVSSHTPEAYIFRLALNWSVSVNGVCALSMVYHYTEARKITNKSDLE